MLVCRDVAHTIGIRILWGKCTTSAECKTIRIAVSAVMDVGMEAARPKGKEFCFMKGSVLPSGTGGIVPGRYGGKLRKCFGHDETTGKVKWVILTYGSFFKENCFAKTLFQQIYRDALSTGNYCFPSRQPLRLELRIPCYSHIAYPCFTLRWFASTFKRTHWHCCPGYLLGQTVKRSTTMKKSTTPKMRTRPSPSQLPVG
jgi:hypothetical protein